MQSKEALRNFPVDALNSLQTVNGTRIVTTTVESVINGSPEEWLENQKSICVMTLTR
ncbi:hypothetical protein GL2_07480 [Microbulbifer sp. GL-2]|nr:hypothetical protein GL2_07480 [Microbulbifer sp. GL-2]